MEARLVIFLGFVAAALIINTAIIYFTYKALADVATKLTDGIHEIQTSTLTREKLVSLQATSAQAVKVTNAVKDQILGFETRLDGIQKSYSESLARIDEGLKLVARAIHFTADKTEKILKWPIKGVNAALAGFQGIVNFMRGSENGADAKSRRNR